MPVIPALTCAAAAHRQLDLTVVEVPELLASRAHRPPSKPRQQSLQFLATEQTLSVTCARPATGNAAALEKLLATEAPSLRAQWAAAWDLDTKLRLPAEAATANPLLATMLALFQESARLLYDSGARHALAERLPH